MTSFGGTKSIVISTVSILGGKNPFLGVAYLVIGSICVLLGLLFLARHIIKPRKENNDVCLFIYYLGNWVIMHI